MSRRYAVRMGAHHEDALRRHLFQDDQDEHGALLLAAPVELQGMTQLLVREVELLGPEDFGPGVHGYRQIAPLRIAEWANRAAEAGLVFVSAHSHPLARDAVGLSGDDRDAHRRLFPHLVDITRGPVVGLVFGQESAAGEVWTFGSSPAGVDQVTVLDHHLRRLTPGPAETGATREGGRFDRQVRLFGADGQRRLGAMHVGVIGAGGGGSMVIEELAHLGVGEITAVDFDVVKVHNLSRIVGARRRDAQLRRKKVAVARRHARAINRGITFNALDADVSSGRAVDALKHCDFLFLAGDSHTSRLVFNALAHVFLIPGVQIGAKVETANGQVTTAYTAVRPVWPHSGCLVCQQLVDPFVLQQEAVPEDEREAQNYLGTPEVVDPSVITLNAQAVAGAMNTFLFAAIGLAEPDVLDHRLTFPASGETMAITPRREAGCRWCGNHEESARATGDIALLPIRRVSNGSQDRWTSFLNRFRH
jgi:hypothetical protein